MMKLKPLLEHKKAQLGLNTVKAVMITFLVMAVVAISVVLALVSLRDSNIFTANSDEYNDTTDVISNVTAGVTNFFDNTSTIFAILVVVVIILAISIIIAVVSRFGGGGATRSL